MSRRYITSSGFVNGTCETMNLFAMEGGELGVESLFYFLLEMI